RRTGGRGRCGTPSGSWRRGRGSWRSSLRSFEGVGGGRGGGRARRAVADVLMGGLGLVLDGVRGEGHVGVLERGRDGRERVRDEALRGGEPADPGGVPARREQQAR